MILKAASRKASGTAAKAAPKAGPPKAETKGSPWPSARQRTVEREAKREAVLHAAAQAFSEKGFHSTSLDDIAVRLGVTKPTLYYYVKSKDEILEAVISRALHDILAFNPSESEQSALDQLLALLRRYAEVVANDFGRSLVRMLDGELSERRRRGIRAAREEINRRIEQLLKRGVAEGSIAPCNVKMTSFMLAGAVNWIGRWYDDDGELEPQEIGAIFADQLARGLLPRP